MILLVGCDEQVSSKDKSSLSKDIESVDVTGRELNIEKRISINDRTKIEIIEKAINNAEVLTEPITDVGPLFILNVDYQNGSGRKIDVWYPVQKMKAYLIVDDNVYLINHHTATELIELLESYFTDPTADYKNEK